MSVKIEQGSDILDAATTLTELVTPFLPAIGTIAGAAVVGIFALWNRRRGAVETRAPDVNEIWQQQALQSRELDMERRLRRRIEDMYRDAVRALQVYAMRVRSGGSTDFTTRETEIIRKPVPGPDTIDDLDPPVR